MTDCRNVETLTNEENNVPDLDYICLVRRTSTSSLIIVTVKCVSCHLCGVNFLVLVAIKKIARKPQTREGQI